MGILNSKAPTAQAKPGYAPPLTLEECTILLAMLSETTFKGKDIQALYQLIQKIEQMRTYYED